MINHLSSSPSLRADIQHFSLMSRSLHSCPIPITMNKAASSFMSLSSDSDPYPFTLSFSMQDPKPAKSPSFVSPMSHHNKLSFHGVRFSSSHSSSNGLRRTITHVQEKRKSAILLSKESCTFLQTCSFCMEYQKDKYTSFLKSPSRLNPLFSSSSPPNATSSTPCDNDGKGAHPLMVNLFCSVLSKSLSNSYRNFHSVNIVLEGNSKIMNDLNGAIKKIFLAAFKQVETLKIEEGAFQFNSSMVPINDLNVLIRFRRDESFNPNKTNLEFPNFKEVVVIDEAPVFYYPLFRTVSVCETMSFTEFCDVFCQMMFTDASPIALNNIIGVPLIWFYNLYYIKELGLIEQIWEKLPSKVVSKLGELLDQTVDDYTFRYYNGLPYMNESLGQRIQLFLEEERLIDVMADGG